MLAALCLPKARQHVAQCLHAAQQHAVCRAAVHAATNEWLLQAVKPCTATDRLCAPEPGVVRLRGHRSTPRWARSRQTLCLNRCIICNIRCVKIEGGATRGHSCPCIGNVALHCPGPTLAAPPSRDIGTTSSGYHTGAFLLLTNWRHGPRGHLTPQRQA